MFSVFRDNGVNVPFACLNGVIADVFTVFSAVNRGKIATIFSFYLIIIVLCLA